MTIKTDRILREKVAALREAVKVLGEFHAVAAASSVSDIIDSIVSQNQLAFCEEFWSALDDMNAQLGKDGMIVEALIDNHLSQHSNNTSRSVSVIKDVVNIWANLHIKHLVGIQPMQGPVSLMFKLRCEKDQNDNNEISLTVNSEPIQASFYKANNINSEQVADIINKRIISIILDGCNSKHEQFTYKCKDDAVIWNNLVLTINRAASNIARLTRRGCGNVLLMNSTTQLKLKFGCDVQRVNEESYVQAIHNKYRIITDDNVPDNKIIVAYKSENSQLDCGIFVSPYILTFNQLESSSSIRYGTDVDEVAINYYEVVEIINAK